MKMRMKILWAQVLQLQRQQQWQQQQHLRAQLQNQQIWDFFQKVWEAMKDLLELNIMAINRKMIIRQCLRTVLKNGRPSAHVRVSKRLGINIQNSKTMVNVSTWSLTFQFLCSFVFILPSLFNKLSFISFNIHFKELFIAKKKTKLSLF